MKDKFNLYNNRIEKSTSMVQISVLLPPHLIAKINKFSSCKSYAVRVLLERYFKEKEQNEN